MDIIEVTKILIRAIKEKQKMIIIVVNNHSNKLNNIIQFIERYELPKGIGQRAAD